MKGVIGRQKKPETCVGSLWMTLNLDLCFLDHLLFQIRLILKLLYVSIYWLSQIFRKLLLRRNIDLSVHNMQLATIHNWVTFCGPAHLWADTRVTLQDIRNFAV